jgi:hypothetical protein
MDKVTAMNIIFEDAKQLKQGVSAVRWDAAKMTVSRTGACRSNTQGKHLIGDFVKRMGGDPNNYQLTYKGAEAAGLMGLYLTKSGDAGVMKVTIYDNSVTFHAGACFEEFPMLRPAAKVDCHIEEIIDGKGNPCLAVHVAAGAPTRVATRRTRKGKMPQPGPAAPDKPEPNPQS